MVRGLVPAYGYEKIQFERENLSYVSISFKAKISHH
jgi:hypothetical protein